ncbi:MAG: SH3 domain-containing protein [Anaerolineae bacterium]|nr:SH3 domain-containing protein [Anaerolineae bacterium]
MKRVAIFTVITFSLLLLVGLGLQPAAAQSAAWTAEYFNNPNLGGAPAVIRTEGGPANNWGYGSPAPGIPVDDFSARWTATAYLPGGSYVLAVKADDGVRVAIDGVLYINRWSPATGLTDTAIVNLAPGNHSFVVEYYEASELAFLEYSFTQAGGGYPPPTQPPPAGTSVTVTAYTLNVRAQPNAWAQILGQINYGTVYPAIGRNYDTSWIQVNINGTIGWVSRTYVSGYGLEALPITDGGNPYPPTPTPIPPQGAYATVTAYALNVRNAPNPYTGAIITRVYNGQTYQAVGRNADTSWLQLNINGTIGWVNSSYVTGYGFEALPITDNSNPNPPPVISYATVTAYYLNVRSAPYPYAQRLTVIARGQTYPAVGRNATSTWIQLNVNGTVGWVNAGWVSVSNLYSLPVTG